MKKKIVCGITGGVAGIVADKLAMGLLDAGYEISVICTESGLYFPRIKTIEIEGEKSLVLVTKEGREICPVLTDKDEWPIGGWHKENPVPHVDFTETHDLLLIAPLTMNTIGVIAGGMANSFLTCLTGAWWRDDEEEMMKPMVLVPAMNTWMWRNPITQGNMEIIRQVYHPAVIDPTVGMLACGKEGVGKMEHIDKIIEKVKELLPIE